jgi:hypothetical protein
MANEEARVDSPKAGDLDETTNNVVPYDTSSFLQLLADGPIREANRLDDEIAYQTGDQAMYDTLQKKV